MRQVMSEPLAAELYGETYLVAVTTAAVDVVRDGDDRAAGHVGVAARTEANVVPSSLHMRAGEPTQNDICTTHDIRHT